MKSQKLIIKETMLQILLCLDLEHYYDIHGGPVDDEAILKLQQLGYITTQTCDKMRITGSPTDKGLMLIAKALSSVRIR